MFCIGKTQESRRQFPMHIKIKLNVFLYNLYLYELNNIVIILPKIFSETIETDWWLDKDKVVKNRLSQSECRKTIDFLRFMYVIPFLSRRKKKTICYEYDGQ